MTQENFLRLALVLDNNNATTINTNIMKLVREVLILNGNNPLTITKIVSEINTRFTLRFANEEVLSAIKKSKKIKIEIKKKEDPFLSLYRLTPEEHQKADSKCSDKLNILITQFIENCEEIDSWKEADIHRIIYKFLYSTFEENTHILRQMIDANYSDAVDGAVFPPEEKELINLFLQWDNVDKNNFVFHAIACGFEYCMMSVKSDNSGFYQQLMTGKTFYLDSNIIFRLMGLNKEERKNVIVRFVTRCKQENVTIKYTNFTKAELDCAIAYHVGLVKQFYRNSQPIRKEYVALLSNKYANMDFIDAYYDWINNKKGRVAAYDAFEDYLKVLVNKTIEDFRMERHENYNVGKTKEKFDELFDSFTTFKQSRSRNTYEGSIATDINNYFFLNEKNENAQSGTALNVNNYFITADHAYVDWTKEIMPGTVPSFVLPSVWYSIMLKFGGRTDDDFAAFSSFLKFRMNEILPERNTALGAGCLGKIVEMQEPPEVKEAIIVQVDKILKSTKESDIENAEKIVEQAYSTVIEDKVQEALKGQAAESNQKMQTLSDQHSQALIQEKDAAIAKGERKEEKRIFDNIRVSAKKRTQYYLLLFWIAWIFLNMHIGYRIPCTR